MIFFSDLDGTLIRSAQRKREGDIVVEYKDGREITCISPESAAILAELNSIVPVTSRSIEQYKRIHIPGFSPKYAITDNGGNLLVDGVPDRGWAAWSASIAEKYADEFKECQAVLESDPDRSFEVRLVDGLFLFTKSDDPERTLMRLLIGLAEMKGELDLHNTGAKVYAVPKEINKGAAVKRFVDVMGLRGEKIVCAGDSVMDIPMLNIADIAIYPDDPELSLDGFSVHREELCEFTAKKAAELLNGSQCVSTYKYIKK